MSIVWCRYWPREGGESWGGYHCLFYYSGLLDLWYSTSPAWTMRSTVVPVSASKAPPSVPSDGKIETQVKLVVFFTVCLPLLCLSALCMVKDTICALYCVLTVQWVRICIQKLILVFLNFYFLQTLGTLRDPIEWLFWMSCKLYYKAPEHRKNQLRQAL